MNWIQGDKFITIADFTFSPLQHAKDDYGGLVNTLDLHNVKNGDVIYTHTMYVEELFEILKGISESVIVVSHNSDINVGDSFVIPDSVSKWFTQNVNCINAKIESIPIGLENDRWFKKERKREQMMLRLTQPRQNQNLVYMNHNIATNTEKRQNLYTLFENKSWVTAEHGHNGQNFRAYLNNISNHKFVICPEGNGMDTHRTWECLYMNTIPIEKRNINNQYYTDLPICFVDDWEEITEDYLNRWMIGSSWQDWNMNKLDFEYWKNKIKE